MELHGVGKDDGAGACVSVKLDISANENSTKRFLEVYTFPVSALDSRNNDWTNLVEKSPSRWCIPCGKYRLTVSTGKIGLVFGRGDYARLRISRTANVPDSDSNTVDLGSLHSAQGEFNFPCSEQGVQISNARFEHNSARLGGALGVSTDRTTNSFFNITSSTFISNTAIMKGGAIHVSGSRSGAFLSGGCVFRNNHVSATLDSYDGK